MEEDDAREQEEEIAALSAIFGDDFKLITENSFEILLSVGEQARPLLLRICFPETYPSRSPPLYEVQANWLSLADEADLLSELDKIATDSAGNVVVFLLTEWIRSNVVKYTDLTVDSCQVDETCDNVHVPAEEHIPASADSEDLTCGHRSESIETSLSVCLLKLDHMRQEARYCSLICRWAEDFGLCGRIFFQSGLILILLEGDESSIKEYIKQHRTQLVDIDRNGRRCKERMLHVVYLGPPAATATATAAGGGAGWNAGDGRRPAEGKGEWPLEAKRCAAVEAGRRLEVERYGDFKVERVPSLEALRAELQAHGVGEHLAAAKEFSYARA